MLHKGDRSYYPTPSKEKGCVSGGILRKEEGGIYASTCSNTVVVDVGIPTYLLVELTHYLGQVDLRSEYLNVFCAGVMPLPILYLAKLVPLPIATT